MSINSNTNSWKCFVWQFHYIIKSLPWYARKLLGYKCRHEIQTLNNDHYIVGLPCCDIKLNDILILTMICSKIIGLQMSAWNSNTEQWPLYSEFTMLRYQAQPHLDLESPHMGDVFLFNEVNISHIPLTLLTLTSF